VNKIWILEGPYGSGKSTLASALHTRGWKYMHAGAPKPGEDVFNSYFRMLCSAIGSGRDAVLDRCYLSESIYGPIMRGKDALGKEKRDYLRLLSVTAGVRNIICLPPIEVCLENWQRKHKAGADYVDNENKFLSIYMTYEWVLKNDKGYEKFDYTTQPLEEFLCKVYSQ
jgi:hypothetical protein